MKAYTIYRQPGPAARASAGRYGYAAPRRVCTVMATGVVDALGEYIFQRYLKTWNRQYAGSRIEFKRRGEWVTWDMQRDDLTLHKDRHREWRLTVTLRNGRSEHETHFVAWRDDR